MSGLTDNGKPTMFPTPMIVELASASKKRFYTAKLEGATDQAAFEEVIRTVLQVVEEVL